MAANLSREFKTLHIEHLLIQRDNLTLVRGCHLQWLSESQDHKISDMHRDIAELLEHLVSHYEALVEVLEMKSC